jgi:hypothetical protein
VGLRKELLADVAELRRLFDLYMGQLANLSGTDAEAAMKAALEAVDQLDGALSLEKVRRMRWRGDAGVGSGAGAVCRAACVLIPELQKFKEFAAGALVVQCNRVEACGYAGANAAAVTIVSPCRMLTLS